MSKQIERLLKEIDENKNKTIKVYALTGCPACIELKEKFDKLGMNYQTVLIDEDNNLWDELAEKGGSDFVPQVEVEDYLIKEHEYTDINELISKTLTNLLERRIIIK
jgi:glutaredoxin